MLKQENGSAVVLSMAVETAERSHAISNGRGLRMRRRTRRVSRVRLTRFNRIDDEIAYAVVGPFKWQVLRAVAELSYREIEK
jgi:hypothetical protein